MPWYESSHLSKRGPWSYICGIAKEHLCIIYSIRGFYWIFFQRCTNRWNDGVKLKLSQDYQLSWINDLQSWLYCNFYGAGFYWDDVNNISKYTCRDKNDQCWHFAMSLQVKLICLIRLTWILFKSEKKEGELYTLIWCRYVKPIKHFNLRV